ncbi:hypothetical protein ON010_g17902 [Phytophthora cinnamomi]|nr:hypothetical protein ON010_g17902 [Phytophthora cinnamomi]
MALFAVANLESLMVQGEKYDESVDIWAIGIIMYELLVGKPPFEAPGQNETIELITEGPLHVPPMVSLSAKDLITRLTAGLLRFVSDRPDADFSSQRLIQLPEAASSSKSAQAIQTKNTFFCLDASVEDQPYNIVLHHTGTRFVLLNDH